MVANRAVDVYKQTEVHKRIHPVKLIHMMYERVLTHLAYAEEGLTEKNPRKRGENLGKAIALITELNAAIRSDDDSEAAQFLRGLYTSILLELPKVTLKGDVEVLRRTARYIAELKRIWEETAMKEHDLGVAAAKKFHDRPQVVGETKGTGKKELGVSVSI